MSLFEITNVISNPNPWEWQLDENNQPQNEVIYITALKFLSTTDEWMKTPATVKHVISLLDKTKHLSSEKPELVYQKLFHNHLTVQFALPDKKIRTLLQETVMAKSEILKMLMSRITESQHGIMTLSQEWGGKGSEIGVDSLNCFLDYISSGNINLTEENVLDILSLGKFYLIPKLEEQCLSFLYECLKNHTCLKDPINLDNFIKIFNFALQLNHVDLLLLCLNRIWCLKDYIVSKTKNDPIYPEITKMLNLGASLEKKYMFCDVFKRGIPSIKLSNCSNSTSWKFLEKIKKFLPISRLEIYFKINFDLLLDFAKKHPYLHTLKLYNAEDVDDKKLEELSLYLNNLHTFSIAKAPITCLPPNLLDRIKKLKCEACNALLHVEASQAERLIFKYCTALAKVRAPRAEKFSLYGGFTINPTARIEVDLPQAKVLFFHSCTIKELNCPQGEKLRFHSCVVLPLKLNVPRAKKLGYNADCYWENKQGPLGIPADCEVRIHFP